MNRPKVTVLCEDKQHGSFIRGFLKRRNRIGHEVPRPNSGAGERFVRDQFPAYLDAVRKRGGILVTMIDGDNLSIEKRLRQLDEACRNQGVSPRKSTDKVVVFVPVRNIETWLAYLGGVAVNETDTYPKLRRESDCKPLVIELDKMCKAGELRSPSPPSLETACQEYRLFSDW